MREFGKLKVSLKKLKRDYRAISPIVATLLLVLITVAAATAFFVFESNWQKTTTAQVGNNGISTGQITTLNIMGSTTVYPFAADAATAFETANPNVTVSVTEGGSGAGCTAVGTGLCDIGTMSSAPTTTQLASYPNLVSTQVAKDGVGVAMSTKGMAATGLISMNYTTLLAIYEVNSGAMTPALAKTTYLSADIVWGANDLTTNKYIAWDDVGTSIGQTTSLCQGSHEIDIYGRSDVSGTEDAFCTKILGEAAVGNHQLSDYGMNLPAADCFSTNQAYTVALANDLNGIGFGAYGIISAATSGCSFVPTHNHANTVTNVALSTYTEVPTSATIAAETYSAYRPLLMVTNGAPTGEAKAFINFCLVPENNLNFCADTGYISMYS